MPSLVIKNLPPDLHRRLKAAAKREHRSMAKQAIHLLSRELAKPAPAAEAPPVQSSLPLTDDLFVETRSVRTTPKRKPPPGIRTI